MNRCLSILILLICANNLSAQIIINSTNNPLSNTNQNVLPVAGLIATNNNRLTDLVDGSPFFQKEWIESTLVTENKSVYNKIPVRINLLDNEIHYQDSSGKEFVLSTPLREISLQQTDKKTVHFINGKILPLAKKGWYVLLDNDSVSLVKGFKKTIDEHRSYGSAPEYRIITNEMYFVYRNNKEFEISKPSDFIKVWPEKESEIKSFIKNANNKAPRDEQLTAVSKFCNSLPK